MIIRRYLKSTFSYGSKHDLLEKNISDLKDMELPFRIDLLPTNFPKPTELKLNAGLAILFAHNFKWNEFVKQSNTVKNSP